MHDTNGTMKNTKNAKTELERRLEEEVRRETESTMKQTDEDNVEVEEEEVDSDEIIEAEAVDPDATEEAPATEIERELAEAQDQLLRLRAEFDNYRKRMARETDRMRKRAAESVILDLLPAVDNLELALKHADTESGSLAEGVRMVLKQLTAALEQNGLRAIPAVGHPFDPRVHEAVSQVQTSEYGRDVVAEEFQRGYMLGDQVLRASRVAVSNGMPEDSDSSASEQTAERDAE